MSPKPRTPSDAEYRRLLALAMPIDVAKLIANGAIIKRGGWYDVIDIQRLPAGARERLEQAGGTQFQVNRASRIVRVKRIES